MDALLLESGDNLLLENGDNLLLEDGFLPTPPALPVLPKRTSGTNPHLSR